MSAREKIRATMRMAADAAEAPAVPDQMSDRELFTLAVGEAAMATQAAGAATQHAGAAMAAMTALIERGGVRAPASAPLPAADAEQSAESYGFRAKS